MNQLLTQIISTSISAGAVILFLLFFRPLQKKLPASFSCISWILVFLQLAWLVPQESSGFSISFGASSFLWLSGVSALLFRSTVASVRLKRRLRTAIPIADNCFEADQVKAPFVLGTMRPRIYLPKGIVEEQRILILLHEQTHIRRWHHAIKPLAFLILCIHWFNPLAWAAYSFLLEDMERSCDERVIAAVEPHARKIYFKAQSDFSAVGHGKDNPGDMLAVSSLAFARLKMNLWKRRALRPSKRMLAVAILIVVLLSGTAAVVAAVLLGNLSLPQLPKTKVDEVAASAFTALAAETATKTEDLKVTQNDCKAYLYLPPKSVSKWIGNTAWTEKKESAPADLSPTYLLEGFSTTYGVSEIALYASDPTLATVTLDAESLTYDIGEDGYQRFEDSLWSASYAEPFDGTLQFTSARVTLHADGVDKVSIEFMRSATVCNLRSLPQKGTDTSEKSVSDLPDVPSYFRIFLRPGNDIPEYFVYKKDEKYYLEQPQGAILELNSHDYKAISRLLPSTATETQ